MGKEKRDARKATADEIAMAKELDADTVDDATARAAAKLASKPIIDNGAEELFEKKRSKEEKKELAAQKKAEREARKAEKRVAAGDEEDGGVAAVEASKRAKARPAEAKAETKAGRILREQAGYSRRCSNP